MVTAAQAQLLTDYGLSLNTLSSLVVEDGGEEYRSRFGHSSGLRRRLGLEPPEIKCTLCAQTLDEDGVCLDCNQWPPLTPEEWDILLVQNRMTGQ